MKKKSSCPVWISLHHHCTILQVRKQSWCDVDVILDQVALSDSKFRPEEFVEIGELHQSPLTSSSMFDLFLGNLIEGIDRVSLLP